MTKRILALARSIDPAEIAAIGKRSDEPTRKPLPDGSKRAATMYVNEAAKAFLKLKTPMRGDIKLIAAKYGISANSIWHKLERWRKLGVNDPYHVPLYALDARKTRYNKQSKATASGKQSPGNASAAS